jgi:hypothetical protein
LEGWNLGGVKQPWRNSARSSAVGSVVARGKKRKSSEEMGFGLSFIGEHCSVEERERESGHRPSSVRLAAPSCPLGARGGRSGPAARRGRTKRGQRRRRGRWERQQGDTWARGGRLRPAAAREAAGGGGSRAHSRDRGGRGPEEEDEGIFAKSQKCRDPTVMLW